MATDRTTPSMASTRQGSKRGLAAVAGGVAGLAAGAFALSFDALRELARVSGVSPDLSFVWPLIVDGFIVIATVAAVMLRPRGRRASWYPWATLIVFAGISVVGNALHASNHADSDAVSVGVAACVSAVPAVALLLSSHLLVVLLAHPATSPASDATGAPGVAVLLDRVEQRSAEAVRSGENRASPPARKARTQPARSVGQPRRAVIHDARSAGLHGRVRAALEEGHKITGNEIADWLGVSPRTGRRRLAQILADNADIAEALDRASAS